MNPPLTPPRRGIEKSPPGRGKGWVVVSNTKNFEIP